MNNSITLKKVSGETITAELISYFELASTGKRYVFYTLNEVVDNNLVKLYVSEVGKDGAVPQTMTPDEWTNIKKIMKAILTGQTDPDVKYLRWEA